MKKLSVVWLLLAVLMLLATTGICFAVEEDEDGNIRQSKMQTLDGDEPPPPPKPKVIVKERVVIQCAPGMLWNPRSKRCVSDGSEMPESRSQAPSPSQQQAGASSVPDYNYVFPRTKLRVKMGQCIMKDEAMTCDITFINTAEGNNKKITAANVSIVDNLGGKFKTTSIGNTYYRNDPYGYADYGTSIKFWYKFTYLNTKADSVTLSMIMWSNNDSDLIKIENFPITK